MNIRKVKIKDVKFCPYNPRKISEKEMTKLKNSIKEFGLVSPLVVNVKTGWVVGGNQRLRALNELYDEDTEVSIVEINLEEEKEKTLNLALNKISGDWDYEGLKGILTGLDTDALDLSGFDKMDLSAIDISLPSSSEVQYINPEEEQIVGKMTFDFKNAEDYALANKFFTNRKNKWDSNKPNTNLLTDLIKNGKKSSIN